MGNPLLDKDFLKELDLTQHKTIYSRLTSLDVNEQPVEYIEGRVTGGSISVDGTSVIRRTCNLTLFSQDVNINEFYWGLNTKIIVEIGLENNINNKYPKVIWFKQGIFVITTFNTSITTNACTISLTGKDKGCLLNGDIAGNLPMSVDFGVRETQIDKYEKITLSQATYQAYQYYVKNEEEEYVLDDGQNGFEEDKVYYRKLYYVEREQLKIRDIILNAVHFYAKEPYENIIINDLEDYGLELLQYRGDQPIYLLRDVGDNGTHEFEHLMIDGSKECYLAPDLNAETIPLSAFNTRDGVVPDSQVEDWSAAATKVYFRGPEDRFTNPYTVAVVAAGESTGYRMTDLVYNGELIANIGETLSSLLDKIKNMLGDFEYFYDIDGRFIFQRKKTFINLSWNSIVTSDDERFAQSLAESSSTSYNFEGNVLISAIQQSPVLNNLKNDYSIWGERTSASGAKVPIHLRYAIHKKPNYYKSFDGKIYCTSEDYVKQIKEKTYKELVAQYQFPLADFEMLYLDEMPPNLIPPTKKANGIYTAGWWDIRDWARYYMAVTGTEEEPCGTMKFYSYNSPEGCVPITSINPQHITGGQRNGYTWLTVVTTTTNTSGQKSYSFNFQHGSGFPSDATRKCTYYETKRDENSGRYVTRTTDPIIRKDFYAPFSACSDDHTYYHFLHNDVEQGRNVYFYNPQFPNISEEEYAIEERIRQEYEEAIQNGIIRVVDWREIIYQMAYDYYQHANIVVDKVTGETLYIPNEEFLITVRDNNKMDNGDYLYPTGNTGYEQYYSDLQGFWRQLYCPTYDSKNLHIQYGFKGGNYQPTVIYSENDTSDTVEEDTPYTVEEKYIGTTVRDFSCDFYLPGAYKNVTDREIANRGYGAASNLAGWANETAAADCQYDSYFNDDYAPWARNVIDNPSALNFWFDFLDDGELAQFDVSAIGPRQKVVNDKQVTAVYNKEIPNLVFVNLKDSFSQIDKKTGYTYCKMNVALEKSFTISAMGKSAKDLLDELLYKFSYCIENVTITSIPIYYLKPNTRIFVHDEQTKIDGDYIVTKFTIPLTYNGTMSITANKAPQRIY